MLDWYSSCPQIDPTELHTDYAVPRLIFSSYPLLLQNDPHHSTKRKSPMPLLISLTIPITAKHLIALPYSSS